MTTLRATDNGRPENLSPEQEAYVADLERQLKARAQPIFTGWPIERWLTAVTLIVVILGGVVATVIRWHDVDVIEANVAKLEQRVDSLPNTTDGIYARKDLYDERMKSMNDKLDSIIVDVKALRLQPVK